MAAVAPPASCLYCSGGLEEPLTHIFNLCLNTYILYVHKRWKITHVIPVHKGRIGTIMNGFRAVAILSTYVLPMFRNEGIRIICHPAEFTGADGKPIDGCATWLSAWGRSTTSNHLNAMEYMVPKVNACWQVDVAYIGCNKKLSM